jgi:hypothetical protein
MRAPVLALTLASATAGGCGGVPQGAADVDQAARELHAAEEAGAREDAQASYYLDLGERELRHARGQLGVGDVEGARSWAARAGADAQLAAMMAIEEATRGAAQRSADEAEAIARGLRRRPGR